MGQVLVNFRLDEQVKRDMEYACREMGLNLSSAFNIFAKKVAREQRLPFTLEVDPFYSPENIERLKRAARRMEQNGGTIHDLDEAEEYAKIMGW